MAEYYVFENKNYCDRNRYRKISPF